MLTPCALLSQGYALLEYSTQKEATAAIEGANNTKLLDQTIAVDFAFVRPPPAKGQQGRGGRGGAAKGGRTRSRSPRADEEKEEGKDD